MCGIAGYSGPKLPGLTQQMLSRIVHRGPDGVGEYDDGQMQLGMVRLAIIDLATGQQPLCNEDRSVWTVFNGEIFNFVELRAELQALGHAFRTVSDTETIVHAYEEWGSDLGHKLNGMFAIAVWDTKLQRLLLIRDRFGVKPLFYAQWPGGLAFASEIKALHCHPRVGRELNPAAMSHYLSLRYVPAPLTIYRDIQALPPGTLLAWDRQGAEVRRWYQLPMQTRRSAADEPELVDELDVLLRDSVRLRLRSDVPYGAYLSGGIDSSTIVGIMTELCPSPVQTFTLSYADQPSNKTDAYYARLVADRFGTEHHEYVMDFRELGGELEHVVRHLDQPFAGVISSFWLSRFIARHVKVALSGDGADEVFGSYGHHRLVWPIAAHRDAEARGLPPPELAMGAQDPKRELIERLAPYAPWEWRLAYAAFMAHEKAALLSRRGREMIGDYSTPALLRAVYEQAPGEIDDLNKMLYLDISTLLPHEILYFNDLLSMAHALEVRTPFLDYRLVELACAIPGDLKIRGSVLKYALRRVAARYLPESVLTRSKEGFVLPKNVWLRQGLAPLVRKVLAADRLALHGWFDQPYVDELVSRFLGDDESLTFKVWTLMIFQLWYEQEACLDGADGSNRLAIAARSAEG